MESLGQVGYQFVPTFNSFPTFSSIRLWLESRFYLLDYYRQVFVEKCKYLEESKCLGICINTCKLPTQVCLCLISGSVS
jgi:hypothetical protein